MLERLQYIEDRFEELGRLMSDQEIVMDHERLQKISKERAGIEEQVNLYREYKSVMKNLHETESMLKDKLDNEMQALVRDEMERLKVKKESLSEALKLSLVPKDPRDSRDVIMEIRAGTGGDEASLFAADLFRMYSRYAITRGWEVGLIDSSPSEVGGFKEVVFEIKGKGAFSRLKHESGVHRVQRVPTTEASGRLHTSTSTVAVLPEADEVELDIRPEEIKMDFYRASGAGGQNVNKLSTAVRLTHLPTGLVAACQDERSQIKNRMKAMAVLRARLLALQQNKQQDEITQERRSQVGSGERAEKIRTYNFPQDRMTDHRLGASFHNLPRIMDGGMDEFIDALILHDQATKLGEIAYEAV